VLEELAIAAYLSGFIVAQYHIPRGLSEENIAIFWVRELKNTELLKHSTVQSCAERDDLNCDVGPVGQVDELS
jgi:hypothetical protein